MSRWAATKYKTKNWLAYNEALKPSCSLMIWFYPEMALRPSPTGRRGRQPSFSDVTVQTCLMMKGLFGMPLRQTTGFVQLLPQIDRTGIKAEGEGEWNARKHGDPKRRIWRKIHIGIDKETLEVRTLKGTGNHIGDAPMLPAPLEQIPPDQMIDSTTADGAYDTYKCHKALAARNAAAVIPPRKNAKPW